MTARRVLVQAAAVVLVLIPVLASAGDSVSFRVGMQLGPSLNSSIYEFDLFTSWLDQETQYALGFTGGLVFELQLAAIRPLSLQTGLAVTRKVADIKLSGSGTEPYAVTWRYVYLSLPVLAKWRSQSAGVRPYISAGVEIGAPLWAEYEDPILAHEPGDDATIDVKDDMSAIEVGLVIAAGAEFSVGTGDAFVGVSYNHGLTDVWEGEAPEYDVVLKNRTATLLVGFLF